MTDSTFSGKPLTMPPGEAETMTGAEKYWKHRYDVGFQEGLKRGAEIAGKTAIYLHHDAGEVKKAKGARAVEQAIQQELSKDCSPSASPED